MTGYQYHYSRVDQDQMFDPAAPHARKRRAGALVKVNLPALMGLRDAALISAVEVLESVGTTPERAAVIRIAPALAAMFADGAGVCGKIIGMFNNPDTIKRESRLFNHVCILSEISSALADFILLASRMTGAVNSDAAGDENFDSAYISRLNERMNVIGEKLFAQLYDAFTRYHERILRYRQYTVKNLSPENAEKYYLAYTPAAEKYRNIIKNINMNIK